MLQTQVKVCRCMRLVSRVSCKYFGRDAEVVRTTSILQVISMWTWGWCVQMKRTSNRGADENVRSLVLAGVRRGSRRLQKTMWYGIMKEFDCKVSCAWSACGREREEAFTYRHSSPEKKDKNSKLDHIIGPMKRNNEIYIDNEGRLWATWDHYQIFARMQEDAHTNIEKQKKEIKSGRGGNRKQKSNHWNSKNDGEER